MGDGCEGTANDGLLGVAVGVGVEDVGVGVEETWLALEGREDENDSSDTAEVGD